MSRSMSASGLQTVDEGLGNGYRQFTPSPSIASYVTSFCLSIPSK